MAIKKWQFQLIGSGGSGVGALSDLVDATNRSFTVRLDDSSEASFTVDGYSPDALLVDELSTDLLVTLNGDKLFRGVVGGTTDTLTEDGYSLGVNCSDYRERLNRRILMPVDLNYPDNVDQSAIAWAAIARAQAVGNHPGGPMGITEGPDNDTGVLRSFPWTAGMKIADDVISALAHLENGFEWDIDPDLVFRVYYPLRGDQSGTKLLDYGGAASSVTRAVDPSQYANSVLMTGGEASFPNWVPSLGAVTVSSGGYFSEGETYRYAVSAILPEGETAAGPIRTVKIDKTGSSNSVKLTWTACPRATGYNIYGRNYPLSPSGVTSTKATTGGSLRGGKTYHYAIVAVSADGVSMPATVDVTTAATTNTNKITLSWSRMPNTITSYRVYGRESGGDPQYLATVAQPAVGTDPSWADTGAADPLGPMPDPYTVHFIDTAATTTYTDGGVTSPVMTHPAPTENVPIPIQSTAVAAGIEGLPEGQWDMLVDDADITRQTTIEQRAQWQLNRLGNLLPSYTVKLNADLWNGPDDLWVGDRVRVVVNAGRLRVDDNQQRVTEMKFDVDEEGQVEITATVGYKPRNIFQKIFAAKSRLDKLERL